MSKTRTKFPPEVCDRAVHMVGEHRADYGSEWEAMTSIDIETARKIFVRFSLQNQRSKILTGRESAFSVESKKPSRSMT